MRFDVYLIENGYVTGRTRAKNLIETGCVSLDGKTVTKPSFDVSSGEHAVSVRDELPYVSRGGLKLAAALEAFEISASGACALDIGASTGGFTDCLLQAGAESVCAVDAGVGQLAASLQSDARVRSYEHLNARDLTPQMLDGAVFDLIVMDVSFISATYILPRFPDLLCDGGHAVVLVKPQFEVGRAMVGKGGIVKDRKAHRFAVERVSDAALTCGLLPRGLIASPIEGGDGNREFLLHLQKCSDAVPMSASEIVRVTG